MTTETEMEGRATAPFLAPANRTETGATTTRAHARMMLQNSRAWVSIGFGNSGMVIPVDALAPLLDEMTEAFRIACEHGLIVEAGNGDS